MPFMVDYSADIQISECMNDIINQVETREWRNVIQHRDRILKKWTKSKAKVEEMKDDWDVATEKISQENSDLHNEIKKLKNEKIYIQTIYNGRYVKYENEIKCLKKENEELKQKRLPKGWVMVEEKSSQKISRDLMKVSEERCNLKKEIEKLQNRIEDAEQRGFDEGRDQYQVDSEYLDEKEDEIKDLKDEIKNLKKQRDEYLENWKSTTRKYVAVTTREQRLNLIDK